MCARYNLIKDELTILIGANENGQKVLDGMYLDSERLGREIVALRPKIDAHFKKLIAGQ
jgi:hypothetical protein